jgi:hypothetical protein
MQLESDIHIKDDLAGALSVKLKPGQALNDYFEKHIPEYNPDRFEVLAIRFFYGTESAVTLYAIDKSRLEGTNFSKDKIPVKKFKLDPNFLNDILPMVEEYNFTLTTGNYPLVDMEVINK